MMVAFDDDTIFYLTQAIDEARDGLARVKALASRGQVVAARATLDRVFESVNDVERVLDEAEAQPVL